MFIVFIYHHHERQIAEDFRVHLGKYEVKMNPIGYEVGCEKWWEAIRADMDRADCFVALVSKKANNDLNFVKRVSLAYELKKPVIPIAIEALQATSLRMVLGKVQFIAGYEAWKWDVMLPALLEILKSFSLRVTRCFVSYSRTEREFATRLTSDLRSRGVKIWIDIENIPAGANWDKEIEKGLNQSTHILFLASRASVQSPNVADEIGFARNKEKTIIPLILEECELPLRVHRAQWVDFQGNYEAGLKNLLEQLTL